MASNNANSMDDNCLLRQNSSRFENSNLIRNYNNNHGDQPAKYSREKPQIYHQQRNRNIANSNLFKSYQQNQQKK